MGTFVLKVEMEQRIVNKTLKNSPGEIRRWLISTLSEQFVDIYDQNTAKKVSPLNLNTMESVGTLQRNNFSSDIKDKEPWFRKPNAQSPKYQNALKEKEITV